MYIISVVVILFLSSTLIFIKGPGLSENFSGYQSQSFSLPFKIVNPDSTYLMPKDLKEISGLTINEEKKILTVNDEKADLYFYDLTASHISSEFDFGKNGDYEAITLDGKIAYISESNGNINVIDITSQTKIKEIKTPLSRRNNIEGIVYEESAHRLLMACKGDLENKNRNKRIKGIYAYDLTSNKFLKDPYALINLRHVIDSLRPVNLLTNSISKISVNSRINAFAPSGMDIDPLTGNLYIVSNRGRILTIMSPKKSIIGIYFLPYQLFGQPEGLAFDNEGNLFISNEANSTKANILRFKRI